MTRRSLFLAAPGCKSGNPLRTVAILYRAKMSMRYASLLRSDATKEPQTSGYTFYVYRRRNVETRAENGIIIGFYWEIEQNRTGNEVGRLDWHDGHVVTHHTRFEPAFAHKLRRGRRSATRSLRQ